MERDKTLDGNKLMSYHKAFIYYRQNYVGEIPDQ